MNKMKIKVCGMRDPANISDLIQFRPDYIGFIFYDKSPRFVDDLDESTIIAIPDDVKKVGVFVNDSFENIQTKVAKYSLDMVQLHGNESPEFCMKFNAEKIPVIKALSVATAEDIKKADPYIDVVDYFLFDTKGKNFGGNGVLFDWKILDSYHHKVPYFISGGIGVEELKLLKNVKLPFGIDINSRFEQKPGFKDISLLKKGFIQIKELNYGKV